MRDQQAPEGARDGVDHQRRLMTQEGQVEHPAHQPVPQVGRQRAQLAAPGDPLPPEENRGSQREHRGEKQRRHYQRQPGQSGRGREDGEGDHEAEDGDHR